MSKMAKEFAEKYLKEELDSRLKHLGGQPDALCQAYQAALEAMAPKKKCYVFTVETRDAQAYLEPACQTKTNGKTAMLKNLTKKTSGLM